MSGFLDSGGWTDENDPSISDEGSIGFGGDPSSGLGLFSATNDPGVTGGDPMAAINTGIDSTAAAPGAPGAASTTPGDPMAAINAGINAAGTQVPLGGGAGGKPLTEKVASALSTLGAAMNKGNEHNPAPVQANLGLRAQGPQSSAFRGENTLSSLMQLLQQRAMRYGPPGSSTGGGRGLLGM